MRNSSLDHLWHVWINARQHELRDADPKHQFEHSLYEFKNMLDFLSYGHKVIADAFEGRLTKTHKQCSRSPELPVLNNRLLCAIGTNVVDCPILLSLKKSFEARGEHYQDVEPAAVYELMAKTCAWHIYKTKINGTEEWGGIDTSEGYMHDESDRMFWSTLYANMAAVDDGIEEEPTK